jgi:NAD(P)-dependent dehydrogenase (short-subunit alcohol dehydrogenase family)
MMLCPGYFLTEMTADLFDSQQSVSFINSSPMGRSGKMHEIDAPFLLLASEAGSYLNGVVLHCLQMTGNVSATCNFAQSAVFTFSRNRMKKSRTSAFISDISLS